MDSRSSQKTYAVDEFILEGVGSVRYLSWPFMPVWTKGGDNLEVTNLQAEIWNMLVANWNDCHSSYHKYLINKL